jgi:hypothetical protein
MSIDRRSSSNFFQDDGGVLKSMRGTSSSLKERKLRAALSPLSDLVDKADGEL